MIKKYIYKIPILHLNWKKKNANINKRKNFIYIIHIVINLNIQKINKIKWNLEQSNKRKIAEIYESNEKSTMESIHQKPLCRRRTVSSNASRKRAERPPEKPRRRHRRPARRRPIRWESATAPESSPELRPSLPRQRRGSTRRRGRRRWKVGPPLESWRRRRRRSEDVSKWRERWNSKEDLDSWERKLERERERGWRMKREEEERGGFMGENWRGVWVPLERKATTVRKWEGRGVGQQRLHFTACTAAFNNLSSTKLKWKIVIFFKN